MTVNVCGLLAGVGFGLVLSWARLTEPAVIRDMLLLREADVFLIMGSAIAVAALGCRLMRMAGVRSLVSREPVQWAFTRPQPRHLWGSALFGVGWSVAGTCPGPVAAMIGQGKVGGLVVAGGILAGVTLHQALTRARAPASCGTEQATVGL